MGSLSDLLNQYIQKQKLPQTGNYDQSFNTGYNDLVHQQQNYAGNLDAQNQQDQAAAIAAQGQLGNEQQDALQSNQESQADRGMTYSGGNINAQGRIREGFQQRNQGILGQLQKAIEGRARQNQGATDEFGSQLHNLFLGHAQSMSDIEQQRAYNEAKASVYGQEQNNGQGLPTPVGGTTGQPTPQPQPQPTMQAQDTQQVRQYGMPGVPQPIQPMPTATGQISPGGMTPGATPKPMSRFTNGPQGMARRGFGRRR